MERREVSARHRKAPRRAELRAAIHHAAESDRPEDVTQLIVTDSGTEVFHRCRIVAVRSWHRQSIWTIGMKNETVGHGSMPRAARALRRGRTTWTTRPGSFERSC